MQSQPNSRQPNFSQLRALWQSLRANCKTIAKFMVHSPQSTSRQEIHDSTRIYHTKTKLYPYLPVSEEQRDWLEHLYHQS
ncbi:MAG: hypothetical protein AAF572_15935 [Cyanobacteria bacterium P01_B01_bin.77]